jgi:hypothetical protein
MRHASICYKCTLSAKANKLNVSGHILMWICFPCLGMWNSWQSSSASFSYTLYIYGTESPFISWKLLSAGQKIPNGSSACSRKPSIGSYPKPLVSRPHRTSRLMCYCVWLVYGKCLVWICSEILTILIFFVVFLNKMSEEYVRQATNASCLTISNLSLLTHSVIRHYTICATNRLVN